MSASDIHLKRYHATESEMDLTSSQSDIGYSKPKTCSTIVKLLALVLILALIVAVAACIAVAVLIHRQDSQATKPVMGTSKQPPVTQPTPTPTPVDNTVCLTPECAVTAARVYQSMDTSVHPCDNFYEFACGSWVKKHPIPEDRSSVSTFSVLDEELTVQLKAMVETPSGPGEIEAVTKAKALYKSCFDEEEIERRGIEPLEVIYAAYGRWPLLNNAWDEGTFDLIDMLIAIRKYGSSPLIYQGVSTDLRDSTVRKLELDQPSLLMPGRDYYLSKANESIPALTRYLTELARALGATDMNQVATDVDAILEFETEVANLTVPAEQRRDLEKLYNLMTIADLYTNISSQLDWLRLIGGMMNTSGVEIPITMEEAIIVYSPEYLTNVVDLIQRTPRRVLANYLIASEIISVVSALPKNIRDIKTEYDKVILGTKTELARWKRCVNAANRYLGNAVGRLFVDASFDSEAKSTALEMITNLRKAFNDLLNHQDWMDDATRLVAKDKANFIKEKIGYDEQAIGNDTALNDKYKDLDLDPAKYFENLLEILEEKTAMSLRKLRLPVDKGEWLTTPAVVNAYYSSTRNTITFPAGILQPPFFSKHYPKSMNYGGIGLVIGHEITHGFDDQGRLFDKYGDLKTWWSDEVSNNFKEKAKCIVDQYSNFTVPEAGMKINGINTQGENIADNGGLRQAFMAYRQWVAQQGKEEQRLPGLSYNHNQLFFLNFAQVWCTAMRPQNAVQRILTGVHSPGPFRVLGVLQNSKEFSEAFNCPRTSYMNPQKKCRVW